VSPTVRTWPARVARWASILTELVLAGAGLAFLSTDQSDLALALWCLVGTVYTVATITVLSVSATRPPLVDVPETRQAGARIEYLVSIVSTLLASLVGVWAALQLVLLRSAGAEGAGLASASGFDILGVWAMLLSWGLLNWGFTQVYRYLYYSRPERPLRFPRTENPKTVDFAYFAFGLGTSFAVSDVETLGSGIRWIALWHSVISFFFNGLIIVLALNIIMSAGH
jgi:uncharacterized membrane protein